ncbi:MAG: EAL domain-containing protein [Burkholderiales bacterium]|nr:EAL domain-containing protein [Burkholderiales bacterium]
MSQHPPSGLPAPCPASPLAGDGEARAGTTPAPAERAEPAPHPLCRLVFQPRVSARGGEIVVVQASLRRRAEPSHAPMAGLEATLAQWALQRVCLVLRRWQQRGMAPRRLVLRLAAGDLPGGRLANEVGRALADNGVPPRWLGIELTGVPDTPDLLAVLAPLAPLRAAGLAVGLADAGAALSALGGLRGGLVDTLSIGRSLLPAPDGRCEALPILRALVAMAHEQGIAVVADGITDARQLDVLVAQGCDLLQGPLLGGPVSAHAVEAALRSGLRPAALPRPLAVPPPRVLIVDDDAQVLAQLQRHLHLRLGDALHLALYSDPAEALRSLRDTACDLVICDLSMPGLDGETLLTAARMLQPDAVRMMLLAPTDMARVLDDPRQVDVFRYIQKPWTAEQLDAHLKAALAQVDRQRTQAAQHRVEDGPGAARPGDLPWRRFVPPPLPSAGDLLLGPGDELVLPTQLPTMPGDLWAPHATAAETQH